MYCRACLVGILLLGLPQLSPAASTTLAWDHSPDSNVAGYLLSYGTQSRNYSAFLRVGYTNSITLSDLEVGQTYYLIVQSYTPDDVPRATHARVRLDCGGFHGDLSRAGADGARRDNIAGDAHADGARRDGTRANELRSAVGFTISHWHLAVPLHSS